MKLDGIRVLDLSLFLPGPTATVMLADHGAEVIKVESLGEGEPNRHIGQRRGDRSVYFDNTHRGKKSLALNLKNPRGRALFLELAQTADVIVEAFRPGVVKRLGVDYDAVAAVNPRIVYASISAFGQTGPLVGRPAHDLAVEALVGLLSNNVDRDGRPVLPAMPAGDMLAAAYAVAGIAMALYRREQTGRGDYLDLAMMDSILFSMPNSMGAAFAEQRPPPGILQIQRKALLPPVCVLEVDGAISPALADVPVRLPLAEAFHLNHLRAVIRQHEGRCGAREEEGQVENPNTIKLHEKILRALRSAQGPLRGGPGSRRRVRRREGPGWGRRPSWSPRLRPRE